MEIREVPSPINLKNMDDALEWESSAMERPYRIDFFNKFLKELEGIDKASLNVLELGSGPGFLALHLLEALQNIHISLLDFSLAMHELARKRVGKHINRVEFFQRNFKQSDWNKNLGTFDAVITNQAVHELRHKDYSRALHEQVKPLLNENGVYLVCDHFYEDGSAKNDQLFMSLSENKEALEKAGYDVEEVFVKRGRVLNRAT